MQGEFSEGQVLDPILWLSVRTQILSNICGFKFQQIVILDLFSIRLSSLVFRRGSCSLCILDWTRALLGQKKRETKSVPLFPTAVSHAEMQREALARVG